MHNVKFHLLTQICHFWLNLCSVLLYFVLLPSYMCITELGPPWFRQCCFLTPSHHTHHADLILIIWNKIILNRKDRQTDEDNSIVFLFPSERAGTISATGSADSFVYTHLWYHHRMTKWDLTWFTYEKLIHWSWQSIWRENGLLQYLVNSLRPPDAIWWHISGSTLAQGMSCWLMAPNHHWGLVTFI